MFEDKNNDFWAIAAGDDDGSAEIVMRYWYPVRSNFFFPHLPEVADEDRIIPGSAIDCSDPATDCYGTLPEAPVFRGWIIMKILR